MSKGLNWEKNRQDSLARRNGTMSVWDWNSRERKRKLPPPEVLALKGRAKLDVRSRIDLRNFFQKSSPADQVFAMELIFEVNETEAFRIAREIRNAFKNHDFVPWPIKK